MTEPEKIVALFRSEFDAVRREFSKRIVGNEDILRFIFKSLLTGGHILLEGLPGLAKTRMVKTVAEILDLGFNRVQFTPDLMPADIVGTNMIAEDGQGRRHFRFEKGPLFTNILLADEINRASPKTQSALLQAMEEREATVFGERHALDDVFFVLATQNPIEMAGTYPLPEAQLDRFMLKLNVAFPDLERLREIGRLEAAARGDSAEVQKQLGRERLRELVAFVAELPVTDRVHDLAAELVYLTHPDSRGAPEATRKFVKYGASPRGIRALLGAARVSALLAGRFHVAVDDIRENYLPCLRHRIILNFEGEVEGTSSDQVLREVFEGLAAKG